MPEAASRRRDMSRAPQALSHNAVRIAIAAAFVSLVLLSYTKAVHWDEFYFLSHVYAFVDGRLDRPLQTFFVHGFTWLTTLPGDEIEQVFVARLLMVGFVSLTAVSLHRIAAQFTDTASANIAVLAFLTSGFVLPHGASFRADPMSAALLTASVALILTTRMKLLHILAAAVLSALALLISIKAALYAPAYLAALVWRWRDKGVVVRILVSGALAVCLFAVLYTWHANGIATAPGKDTATTTRSAATTVLLEAGWFPRARYIAAWAILSAAPLALMLIGLGARKNVKTAALLVLLASPLLSVVIYRNAFPYFFPFAVPLMMVAVAFGAQAMRHSRWMPAFVAVMVVTGAFQAALSLREGAATQRATLAEVHRLFPAPVPYIDANKMVASFPSFGPFMSGWGLKNYHARGVPVFVSLIATHQPPLLIANKGPLITTMAREGSGRLLPEDDAALHETYVQYNGAIWLAGRKITLTQTDQPLTVPFAGQYRVQTSAPVQINGQRVSDADTVTLEQRGTITGAAGTQVKLIWDTGVPPLQTDLPTEGMNSRFWSIF